MKLPDSRTVAVINCLANFGLLITTFFYLEATIGIESANIIQSRAVSEQNFILYRPYVGISSDAEVIVQKKSPGSPKPAATTNWFDLRLRVENAGQVLALYTVEEFSFNGSGSFPNVNSVLFPKSSKLIHQKFNIPLTNISGGFSGEGKVRIKYWAHSNPSETHFFSFTFRIQPNRFFEITDESAN